MDWKGESGDVSRKLGRMDRKGVCVYSFLIVGATLDLHLKKC